MFAKKLPVTEAEASAMASESYSKDETNPFEFLLLTDKKRFSEMRKQMIQLNEVINTCQQNVCSEQELIRCHVKHQQQKTIDVMHQLQQLVESEHKEYLQELEEFEIRISQQQQYLENNQGSDTELDAELAQNANYLSLLEHPNKTEICKCYRQHPKETNDRQAKSNELGTQVFQCLENLKLLEEDTG